MHTEERHPQGPLAEPEPSKPSTTSTASPTSSSSSPSCRTAATAVSAASASNGQVERICASKGCRNKPVKRSTGEYDSLCGFHRHLESKRRQRRTYLQMKQRYALNDSTDSRNSNNHPVISTSNSQFYSEAAFVTGDQRIYLGGIVPRVPMPSARPIPMQWALASRVEPSLVPEQLTLEDIYTLIQLLWSEDEARMMGLKTTQWVV